VQADFPAAEAEWNSLAQAELIGPAAHCEARWRSAPTPEHYGPCHTCIAYN